jgi:hypothetical protein
MPCRERSIEEESLDTRILEFLEQTHIDKTTLPVRRCKQWPQ